LFATVEEEATPPVLGLAFRNPEAARKIFDYWRAELGDQDLEERLRVVIVRGSTRPTRPGTGC
jgi:hypothetical protein